MGWSKLEGELDKVVSANFEKGYLTMSTVKNRLRQQAEVAATTGKLGKLTDKIETICEGAGGCHEVILITSYILNKAISIAQTYTTARDSSYESIEDELIAVLKGSSLNTNEAIQVLSNTLTCFVGSIPDMVGEKTWSTKTDPLTGATMITKDYDAVVKDLEQSSK